MTEGKTITYMRQGCQITRFCPAKHVSRDKRRLLHPSKNAAITWKNYSIGWIKRALAAEAALARLEGAE